MNAWLRIRRLRGPAFLILVGITALLDQWGGLSFGRSWPLYLILAGAFGLAERAALSANPVPPSPYAPSAPYGGYTSGVTSIVPRDSAPAAAETDAITDPDRRL